MQVEKNSTLGTRLFAKTSAMSPSKATNKGGIIDRTGQTSSQQIIANVINVETVPGETNEPGTSKSVRHKQSMMGYKIPCLENDHKLINQQFERVRMIRANSIPPIEYKLRMFSQNANINTTQKEKRITKPEQNFRSYIDNQIDMMSRLSCDKLRHKIIKQNTLLEQQQRMLT